MGLFKSEKVVFKFKKGQVVKNPYGQFGYVTKMYRGERGNVICHLDGDMYPFVYDQSDLKALSRREKGD
jgi:hypothetical protein